MLFKELYNKSNKKYSKLSPEGTQKVAPDLEDNASFEYGINKIFRDLESIAYLLSYPK
jgi:hypothetical protein